MNISQVMLEQLATDFNTTPQTLMAGKNVFSKKQSDPRKRAYENGDAALQVLCVNGIAVFNALDDELLEALREKYSTGDAAWLLEICSLREMDELLSRFGQRVQSYHQYYVPGKKCAQTRTDFAAKWFEGGELDVLAGDERFDEALAGNPAWPDMLAVGALEGETIIGLAGASRDSEKLWQIGINVDAGARGRGIATALVTLLKDELLRRGIVPFYGTAASHILSQRVAVASGFVPAWAEMYTAPLKCD